MLPQHIEDLSTESRYPGARAGRRRGWIPYVWTKKLGGNGSPNLGLVIHSVIDGASYISGDCWIGPLVVP